MPLKKPQDVLLHILLFDIFTWDITHIFSMSSDSDSDFLQSGEEDEASASKKPFVVNEQK